MLVESIDKQKNQSFKPIKDPQTFHYFRFDSKMGDRSESYDRGNKKQGRAIRRIFVALNQKLTERYELIFDRLKRISIQKSPQFMALKSAQLGRRLSKLYKLKLRQCFDSFFSNTLMIEIEKKQKLIQQTKVKDRAYEARVKALRVLSRQWKEKKSQSIYKNTYFTPKSEQTPKMQKEKVCQEVYLVLRNILRNKYHQAFNVIKVTENIKIRNSKTLYLLNYLGHKRRYWMSYGMEKMKTNALRDRQGKHNEEIVQLDTKLTPMQDSQIVNLREKQEKLQSALDGVMKEKKTLSEQIDTQIAQIQQSLEDRRNQIKQLQFKGQNLSLALEDYRQKTQSFEFSREEIFHLIYTNFLTNLKLWAEMKTLDKSNPTLSKQLVQQWLQCPVIDFHLDKISLQNSTQLNQTTETLSSLFWQYKRLRGSQMRVDLGEVVYGFFSGKGVNQCCESYEEFLSKNKLMHKMVSQVMKENDVLMVDLLQGIKRMHEQVTQGSFQILEN